MSTSIQETKCVVQIVSWSNAPYQVEVIVDGQLGTENQSAKRGLHITWLSCNILEILFYGLLIYCLE